MKSLRNLLVLVAVIAFASCSDEYKVSKNLEGLWDISVYQKVVYKGNEVDFDNSGSWEEKGKIEFTSDGKGYFNILEDLGAGVYNGAADFTWTNTGTTVSITTSNETKVFTIVSSEDNYFELDRTVPNFYFSGSEPGVDYSLYERMVIEK